MSVILFNRFNWQGGVVSNEDYPVQIMECTCFWVNHTRNKIVRNTWDMVETTDYSKREDSFPKNFEVKWYAYNEDRFFEASIPLPSDTLVHYAKKYRKQTQDENRRRGFYSDAYYLYLVADIKPDGIVSVWLSNGRRDSERIELYANFQGIEIDFDESKLDMDEGLTKEEWNEIVTTRKYNWKVVPLIEELPGNAYITEMEVNSSANISYNCKADYENEDSNSSSTKPLLRYIPEHIRIKWRNNQNKSHSASLHFQTKEISQIFTDLYKETDRLQQSEISIRFDRYFKEKHDSTDVRIISNPNSETDYYNAIITIRKGYKSFQVLTTSDGRAIYHPRD